MIFAPALQRRVLVRQRNTSVEGDLPTGSDPFLPRPRPLVGRAAREDDFLCGGSGEGRVASSNRTEKR
jgi:hypothetical protein